MSPFVDPSHPRAVQMPDGQNLPQPPQLLGSVASSTQTPPQFWVGDGHAMSEVMASSEEESVGPSRADAVDSIFASDGSLSESPLSDGRWSAGLPSKFP